MKRWGLTGLILLGIAVAVAQDGPTPRRYRARLDGGFGSTARPILNAPFSGQTRMDREEDPTVGTKATVWLEFLYRDRLGRTRTERSLVVPDEGPESRFAQIVDPVGGYEYFLDPVHKVAHRITVPPADQEVSKTPFVLNDFLRGSLHLDLVRGMRRPEWVTPDRTTTELGEQTMDGVRVRGTRIVEKYPAGVLGKSGGVRMVIETWISDERKVAIFSKRVDPVNKNSEARLRNYNPAEPAWDLFTAPRDYQVIDERGAWSVDIVIPERNGSKAH